MVCCSSSLSSLAQAGGCGQATQDGRAVEAPVHLLGVVVRGVIHGQSDLAAHHVGFHQIAPGSADGLAQGQQSREDGNRGVTEAAEIVVIQGVTHCSVDQRGVHRRGALAGGEDGCLVVAAEVAGVVADDVAHLLRGAGQDHPNQVEAGFVGDTDGVRRNVLIRRFHDPFCHHFSCAHGAKPPCKMRFAMPLKEHAEYSIRGGDTIARTT